MNNPTIYYADINDHDETGSDEPAFCHVVLASEYNQLRAELAALKAGQGEAVAWINNETLTRAREKFGSYYLAPVRSDEDDTPLYTAPPASADAVSVAPGLERAIQIVREVAKTQPGYSDEREAIFEALSEAYAEAMAPPCASAAVMSVPIGLLRNICSMVPEKMKPARKELRALLAQSESKVKP